MEPTLDVHQVRNTGAVNPEFWVTFLDIPVGSAQRLEPEVDPNRDIPTC